MRSGFLIGVSFFVLLSLNTVTAKNAALENTYKTLDQFNVVIKWVEELKKSLKINSDDLRKTIAAYKNAQKEDDQILYAIWLSLYERLSSLPENRDLKLSTDEKKNLVGSN